MWSKCQNVHQHVTTYGQLTFTHKTNEISTISSFHNFSTITFTHKTNEISTILHFYTYDKHQIINILKLFKGFLDVLSYGKIVQHGAPRGDV